MAPQRFARRWSCGDSCPPVGGHSSGHPRTPGLSRLLLLPLLSGQTHTVVVGLPRLRGRAQCPSGDPPGACSAPWDVSSSSDFVIVSSFMKM